MKVRFIFPGDLDTPTGGYHYDRQIVEAWSASGIDVDCVSLKGDFPNPSTQEVDGAINKLSTLEPCDVAVIDGLAGGASSRLMEAISKVSPVASLIHHPLCLENGLAEELAKHLQQEEQVGLRHVSKVITTSPATKTTVTELFGYPSSQIETVLPGVERKGLSEGGNSDTINLLCVASVIERKGHKFLFEALAGLADLSWKLDCIGMTDIEPELYDHLINYCEKCGISDRVMFHGAVDEKRLDDAYRQADLFVLPSLYEGYGMVYAEAIVRGLPIVATNAGAIPDTVPKGCGLLVEPSNALALRKALKQVMKDADLRLAMRHAAIKAEPGFPTWKHSAKKFAAILWELI